MSARYRVTLTDVERHDLRELVSGGKARVRRVKRAQILLAADRGETEAAIFEATGSFDVWSSAERVRTPTLIEWSPRGLFPRAVYERLAARMTDARVCDIDAGHLAPMQHPDRVVAPILEFASRNP